MIKVYCFVSCVCKLLKKTTGVDHRPYYFGVWDLEREYGDDDWKAFRSTYSLFYKEGSMSKEGNMHIEDMHCR